MIFCLFTDFYIIFLFVHLIKKTYLCFYDNKQKRFNELTTLSGFHLLTIFAISHVSSIYIIISWVKYSNVTPELALPININRIGGVMVKKILKISKV